MKMLIPIITAAAMMLITGCASVISGTSQNVNVQSIPAGAKATFFNKKGEAVTTQTTPFIAPLQRSETYKLKVELENYEPYNGDLKKGLNGWYLGNFIFGGAVGMLVDMGSGAANSQPATIKIELAPVGSGQQSHVVKPPPVKSPKKTGDPGHGNI